MLSIAPSLHAKVAMTAKLQGKSINQWTSQILEEALHYNNSLGLLPLRAGISINDK